LAEAPPQHTAEAAPGEGHRRGLRRRCPRPAARWHAGPQEAHRQHGHAAPRGPQKGGRHRAAEPAAAEAEPAAAAAQPAAAVSEADAGAQGPPRPGPVEGAVLEGQAATPHGVFRLLDGRPCGHVGLAWRVALDSPLVLFGQAVGAYRRPGHVVQLARVALFHVRPLLFQQPLPAGLHLVPAEPRGALRGRVRAERRPAHFRRLVPQLLRAALHGPHHVLQRPPRPSAAAFRPPLVLEWAAGVVVQGCPTRTPWSPRFACTRCSSLAIA